MRTVSMTVCCLHVGYTMNILLLCNKSTNTKSGKKSKKLAQSLVIPSFTMSQSMLLPISIMCNLLLILLKCLSMSFQARFRSSPSNTRLNKYIDSTLECFPLHLIASCCCLAYVATAGQMHEYYC